jgi:hypothetical protein
MPVFDVTEADAGTVLVAAAGSLTKIEVPATRGTSGRFSLTDTQLNVARGFWQPIIAIDVDSCPAPVALVNANPNSANASQMSLIGAPIAFTTLRLDAVPKGGAWRVTTA